MIRIGAEETWQIFLWKITPKGESDSTPEEKLLVQSGDKAGEKML
jgi:hypothetical protein